MADTLGPGGTPSLGNPSPGGTGYASFYVDQAPFDGLPDRNSTFGGAFVNAGDPAWYDVINNMTVGVEGNAGLREIFSLTVGKGLGCDGIFMDTIDTCAPDSFGATELEWTAPGYEDLVERISTTYPSKILLANRGLFFYSPNFEHYEYSLRPHINILMYESYYTDSSTENEVTPGFNDNKFNLAPKINAEANRTDGFTPIALGYDEPSTITQTSIDQDFIESQQEQGWMLYRTNAAINDVMNFDPLTWAAANTDTSAPVWDNTEVAFAGPSDPAPTPRVGIQEAVAGDEEVTVRWDVARDQTLPVLYNLYYSEETSPGVIGGTDWMNILGVTGTAPENYAQGAGAGVYANEYTITGLTNGINYSFAVRAQDSAAIPHEDANTVILQAFPVSPDVFFTTITIDGDFADWAGIPPYVTDPAGDSTAAGGNPDWLEMYLANDDDWLYVRLVLAAAAPMQVPGGYNIFFDTDNSTDGFAVSGSSTFGSEILLQNGGVFEQQGGGFNEGVVTDADFLIAPDPTTSVAEFEFRISRSSTFPTDSLSIFTGSTVRVAASLFDAGFAAVDDMPQLPAATPPTYTFANEPMASVEDWLHR
jgi:hypothetical protein